MAACPAIPPAAVGSILLLIMSTNPVWGDQRRSYCGLHSHLGCPGHRAGCSRLGLLGGEEEEADRSTYRPSAEEQCGTSCTAPPDALKLPKEERLI
ncbi:unnamed protein product [Tetraodon nigroviridis]|uniref:(spotted green pufferfish) hypothetical protein n=1 Tax=Tetraodon nigroviridis TaxID=99883 RepID=Q4SE18_TETNG|nr:unnamed protein product [Tetraodon nigroviridis]